MNWTTCFDNLWYLWVRSISFGSKMSLALMIKAFRRVAAWAALVLLCFTNEAGATEGAHPNLATCPPSRQMSASTKVSTCLNLVTLLQLCYGEIRLTLERDAGGVWWNVPLDLGTGAASLRREVRAASLCEFAESEPLLSCDKASALEMWEYEYLMRCVCSVNKPGCYALCTFNCIILHRTWIWKNISSSCDEDLMA